MTVTKTLCQQINNEFKTVAPHSHASSSRTVESCKLAFSGLLSSDIVRWTFNLFPNFQRSRSHGKDPAHRTATGQS